MATNFPQWEESASCNKIKNKFSRQTDVFIWVLHDMDLTWNHSVVWGRLLLKDEISYIGYIDIWSSCARQRESLNCKLTLLWLLIMMVKNSISIFWSTYMLPASLNTRKGFLERRLTLCIYIYVPLVSSGTVERVFSYIVRVFKGFWIICRWKMNVNLLKIRGILNGLLGNRMICFSQTTLSIMISDLYFMDTTTLNDAAYVGLSGK
jgi:hypothetical protein